jgi:Fe-S-cluster containining protein
MDIYEISFFNEFECMGGQCPHTCCHGWMIPLSEEDRKRFRKERGLLKCTLFLAMSSRYIYCFNKGSGTCPFLNRQGLCSLQLKKGHDFIPEACRMYPRFYRNYGYFEEHYLDLSCIRATTLFINNLDNLSLTLSQGSPLSDPCTTNDDLDLLDKLMSIRSFMIEHFLAVNSVSGLNEALGFIDRHSFKVQDMILKDMVKDHSIDLTDPVNFMDIADTESVISFFPIKISFCQKVLGSSFYNIFLKKSNPILYRLCSLAKSKYADIMKSQDKWEAAVRDFTESNKEAAGYLAAYYTYYLYQYYLRSFEDYSFLRNCRIGMVHVNMIFMFMILKWFDVERQLTNDDIALITAVYDRRACFNNEIIDELYKIISDFLPKRSH